MKKVILCFAITLSLVSHAFAGGLLTNTNQHILFLRNPARGASIQIDALYSNPAGISFMKDGLHLSLNIQSAYQTRTITSTFAPFAGYGGNATKVFEGKASAPVVPSLYAVYKKDRWAFGAHFAVTGGGGKATFNRGLGSFESKVAVIPGMLTAAGLSTSEYSVDSYMEGKQMIFGLQFGAAYRITDYLSAYGGLRMNMVSNGYIGHVRGIQANVGGGPMVNLHTLFTGMGPGYETYAQMTADKYLDCDQSGWGVTPVIGADFKMGQLNVGVKYEFRTALNVENKTRIDDTNMFKDGVNTPHDIPSMLSLGASFEILPVLRVSAGYHHFFDKNAEMAGDKQKFIDEGTNEYLFGVEWDITRVVQVSAGMQRTKYGVGDGYQSDMSFSLSSYSFGFGAGFNLNEKMKLNVAYFQTEYSDYTKDMANYNGTGVSGRDLFSRTNKVFGVGLDYTF